MSELNISGIVNGPNEYRPQWLEPEPLPGGLPAVPAFDEHLLPDSLRSWIVDIADRAQAPLDFPAAGAITALSSAVGRRFGIRPKRRDDWLVVPNLWGLTVGPPGILKSPMLREILTPLSRLEAQASEASEAARVEHEVREAALQAEKRKLMAQATRPSAVFDREQLMAHLRGLRADPPKEQRYIVNDSTVEALGKILNQNPHGVLLFRDEIAGFLATMERAGHENDRAFYLEAWNGRGAYTYDRILRGTSRIEAACVSILGAITPGPLSAYLRETFGGSRDDGLIQRFQLSVYPDATSWCNVDRPPDADAQRQAFEIFQHLTNLDRGSVSFGSDPQRDKIPSLHFDEEAQDFFDGWRADLEARLRDPDEHPVMAAHLSKYRSLMPSLALIFHASDGVVAGTLGPAVNLEPTQRAAAWCDYLEAHARRIYHGVIARADATIRLLGQKIRARKLSTPFTARDVYRPQWAGLTEPADVTSALEALEDLGWLKAETIAPATIGGRPTKRYHISPRVTG